MSGTDYFDMFVMKCVFVSGSVCSGPGPASDASGYLAEAILPCLALFPNLFGHYGIIPFFSCIRLGYLSCGFFFFSVYNLSSEAGPNLLVTSKRGF